MRGTLILRLVDITLLLLLSLMAVSGLAPYDVEPPESLEIEPEGVVLRPLTVAMTPAGAILAHDVTGAVIEVDPLDLAATARSTGQSVEVIADRSSRASDLLSLHRTLMAESVSAVFMVQPALE